MQLVVQAEGASLLLEAESTLPLRVVKKTALEKLRSNSRPEDLEVWLGDHPGTQLLEDHLTLGTQRLVEGSVLSLWPRASQPSASPLTKSVADIVTSDVDELISRGALQDCSLQMAIGLIYSTICASLQHLASTGVIKPWYAGDVEVPDAPRRPLIRPDLDLYLATDGDPGLRSLGERVYTIVYFFVVDDDTSCCPLRDHRVVGAYHFDATSFILKQS
jgi:hypothetical protein